MATVVISAYKVASKPEIGGHFWVYLQYVQGLRRLGCEVFWLERLRRDKLRGDASTAIATFFRRMEQHHRFFLDAKENSIVLRLSCVERTS